MSYKNRLEKLKDAWNKDKPAESQSGLPNGKYQLEIKRAVLEESKASFNKGHLMVVFYLVVVTGEFKGRKTIVRVDLEQEADIKKGFPSGISRFKQYLEIMSLDMPKSLNEASLNEILKESIGMVLNATAVVNAKGYTNVYLNDLVRAASDETEEEDDEEDEEEDEDEDDEEEEDDEDDEDEDEEDEEDKKPEPKKPEPKKPETKPSSKKPEPKKPKEDDEEDEWDLDDA